MLSDRNMRTSELLQSNSGAKLNCAANQRKSRRIDTCRRQAGRATWQTPVSWRQALGSGRIRRPRRCRQSRCPHRLRSKGDERTAPVCNQRRTGSPCCGSRSRRSSSPRWRTNARQRTAQAYTARATRVGLRTKRSAPSEPGEMHEMSEWSSCALQSQLQSSGKQQPNQWSGAR